MASERNEGSAKRRDLRHAQYILERSPFFSAHVATMEEKRGSAEGRVNAPLPGLGQRPVSEANAFEFELELELELESKDFNPLKICL